MNELFLTVLNQSISASWLILAVLLCRLILKSAPRWVPVLLWGIVAFRLLCPFSFESTWSLIPSTETIPIQIALDPNPAVHTGLSAVDHVINPIIPQTSTPTHIYSANPLQIVVAVCSNLWILGMIVLLFYTIISCWHLSRKVRTAVRFQNHVFQSDAIDTPFVFGVICPKIYIPFQLDEQNFTYVLAHEQAHIHRRDHWWKPLGFLLLSIHWFNPLMWLAYVLFCRDIELACDEAVIRTLNPGQRADYTQALVSCSVSRRIRSACPLAFGEIGVKERVKSVMNYKKPTFWLLVASVLLCTGIALCFLTDPKQEPSTTGSDDLIQYRTMYLGDAPNVSKIAQRLSYPDGYTYASIELQTSTPPYELIVYLHGNADTRQDAFADCAETAFRLIGNLSIISFRDADSNAELSSFQKQTAGQQFYLTVCADHIAAIEITTPAMSGGCKEADGSSFQNGERVWLEQLDGRADLRGVTITALDMENQVVWSVSIPDTEESYGLTYVTQDGWTISAE